MAKGNTNLPIAFGLIGGGALLAYAGLKGKTVVEALKGLPGTRVNTVFEADARAAAGKLISLRSARDSGSGAAAAKGGGALPAPSGRANDGWGGSKSAGLPYAKPYLDRVISEKRPTKYTASGGISDHWEGNKDAYAWDIGARGSAGDRIANAIATRLGRPSYRGGYWLNVERGGYRFQLGWKVPDHYDHVHFGVQKI